MGPKNALALIPAGGRSNLRSDEEVMR